MPSDSPLSRAGFPATLRAGFPVAVAMWLVKSRGGAASRRPEGYRLGTRIHGVLPTRIAVVSENASVLRIRLIDVRLDPSMADAYGQLGDTYRSMDDYDESVRHYECDD